jgi:uncharacterized protein YbcC (UPF0753/DUF2309 family)
MELGRRLKIRTLTHVAGEVIPFFWPMRNFIHHNPLHELESLPFEKAVREGKRIFGGKGFLRRRDYRLIYQRGVIKKEKLMESVRRFIKEGGWNIPPVDLEAFIYEVLVSPDSPRPYSNLYLHGGSYDPPRPLVDYFLRDPREEVEDFIRGVGTLRTFPEAFEVLSGVEVVSEIEERLTRGVFAFLDEGNASLPMPSREKGLYLSWREVFYDRRKAPPHPEEAIETVLRWLRIPEQLWESYLTLELSRCKGIAGFIRWRSSASEYYWQAVYPADIVDLAAVRLLTIKDVLEKRGKEAQFGPDLESMRAYAKREPLKCYARIEIHRKESPLELLEGCLPENIDQSYSLKKAELMATNFMLFLERVLKPQGIDPGELPSDTLVQLARLDGELEEREGMIWLRALEESLVENLFSKIKVKGSRSGDPRAQFLFCIDVRSERIRKAIEEVGNYRTFGIAGFFGVPMAFVQIHRGHEEFLCPVLIKPRNVVLEVPSGNKNPGDGHLQTLEKVLHDLKANLFSPFITVEAVGFLFGFDFLGKTFMPSVYGPLRESFLSERIPTKIRISKLSEEEKKRVIRSLGAGDDEVPYLMERLSFIGFSREEQATLIAKALESIGLTENFAPYVFVIGHESRSDNNPYESALDCGACGGASGVYNARVFCMMANDLGVREILKKRHRINIPSGTIFIPGVHNTTTDRITLYDFEPYREQIEDILKDLEKASQLTARKRAVELEDRKVKARAYDWSQVRPEWGLSGNYAFIIGRRELTEDSHFDGKVFLHSYDYRKDPKGFLLETILSGPLVVGQWINMEHYFSTTDNEVYGSSSKVYHNVVGRIGVMTGNLSDLRTGLPYQTLWRGNEPHHLPVRLITLIEAPFEFARKVIERVYQVRLLVENRWINLFIVDPVGREVWRYFGGEWVRWFKEEVEIWES